MLNWFLVILRLLNGHAFEINKSFNSLAQILLTIRESAENKLIILNKLKMILIYFLLSKMTCIWLWPRQSDSLNLLTVLTTFCSAIFKSSDIQPLLFHKKKRRKIILIWSGVVSSTYSFTYPESLLIRAWKLKLRTIEYLLNLFASEAT